MILFNYFLRSDDPLLLEVNYTPFQLNNKTILDDKCPPGWSLILDTCYMYVGAPMTFFEAREFCRSDNATMPFIRGSTDILWLYLQRQMVHLRYPDRVWIQDLSHLEQCTSFLYRTVEIDDCNSKRGFICEIDPKVILLKSLFCPRHLNSILVLIAGCFITALLANGHCRCCYNKCFHSNHSFAVHVRILLVLKVTSSSCPAIATTE